MSTQKQVPLQQAFSPSAGSERWTRLARDVESCNACILRSTCQRTVLGEGDLVARVMLIGEGPGSKEDAAGRPFVGPAGQLLDSILASVGYSRREVYITNIVKCRPPGNRLPKPIEVGKCLPYLHEQISLVNPKIIGCLGALATRTLVDPGAYITRVRGSSYQRDGRHLVPTFHPAALLRDPSKKRPVWEDFKLIKCLEES